MRNIIGTIVLALGLVLAGASGAFADGNSGCDLNSGTCSDPVPCDPNAQVCPVPAPPVVCDANAADPNVECVPLVTAPLVHAAKAHHRLARHHHRAHR